MTNRRAGMLTVLKNRDFAALWMSQLISKVGDNFAVVASLVLINELAEKVQRVGMKLGIDVTIDHLENPRKEADQRRKEEEQVKELKRKDDEREKQAGVPRKPHPYFSSPGIG